MAAKIRCAVRLNRHAAGPGVVLIVPDTWDAFTERVRTKIQLARVGRVYLSNGSLVDEVEVIQNDDLLYVDEGNGAFFSETPAPGAGAGAGAGDHASAGELTALVAALRKELDAERQARARAESALAAAPPAVATPAVAAPVRSGKEPAPAVPWSGGGSGKAPAPSIEIPSGFDGGAVKPMDVQAQSTALGAAHPSPRVSGAAASGALPSPRFEVDVDTIVAIIDYKYPREVVELVMRHFAGSAEALISRLLAGIDVAEYQSLDAALAEAARSPPRVFECPVCYGSFPVEEMFTFDCEASHRMCTTCTLQMVTLGINEGMPMQCALCPHKLTEPEIVQVAGDGELFAKYKDNQLRRALGSLEGAIACPTPDCTGYEVASTPGVKERVECSICHRVFCSLCRECYHFQCTCAEYKAKQNAWMTWLSSGREEYVARLSAVDREYEARLNEFESVRHAHMQAVKESLRRLRENEHDEDWLAANCRLCPSCRRVINKVSGCDSMVCGRNYHGGDEQDGCGHSFNWATAPAYEKANITVPTVAPLAVAEPEHGMRVSHVLDRGSAAGDAPVLLHCDFCSQEIFGPVFRCMNCPAYNLCIRCQPRYATLGHNNHVFDVVHEDRPVD